MPGQNDPRQFGAGQMNFEFNPRPVDRLPQPYTEHGARRTPSPHYGAYPSYPDRFLPPIQTHPQFHYETSQRPGLYRPNDAQPPEQFSYALPAEGQWGRSPWRSPSWQERRVSQGPSNETWARPPISPQRRDMLPQPVFEPSENWKQSHRIPPDHHERRSFDFRSSDSLLKEREYPLDRPREQYPPPTLVPNSRYRADPPISLKSPQNYSPSMDSTRHQHSTSPSWSPSSYPPPPTGYIESQLREPHKSMHWDPHSSPRAEYDRNAFFRREKNPVPGLMQATDEPLATMYRERSASQQYSREIPPEVTRWSPPSRNPGPSLPSPQLRPSGSSYESPQHIRSHSQSSTRSLREDLAHPVRVTPLVAADKVEGRSFIPPLQSSRPAAVPKHPVTLTSQDYLHATAKLDTRPPAPPAASQTSDLEKIVNYEWPTSTSTTLPSILTASTSTMNSEETEEAAVSRLLEPEPEKSSAPEQLSSPPQAAKGSTLARDNVVPPAQRIQDSPEPDIPLALQSAASRGGLSTSSNPDTPVGEPNGPPQISLEEKLAGIPPMPMHEALRVIVMVRLQQETQTQEERVNPVLMDNLAKAEPLPPSVTGRTDLMREVNGGERMRARKEAFESSKSSLEYRFARRQVDLNEKVERLRTEYLTLHEQWIAHCAKLDEVAKNLALQEAAATAGRTTRRSAASMGDAVRSDLEMEQIIASLGNEELTDATHLGARNAATIPDMIAVTVGEVEYSFDDTNNEVDDPAKYYAPRTGTYDWTEEEITTFVEKFAQFPKQFGIIADFLPHKTPAQCVTFYYLHKNKHIDFRKVVASRVVKRKRGGRKQKNNALLTDIRQKDAETAPTRRRKGGSTVPPSELRKPSTRRAALQSENTPTATPTPEPESEPRKRRARNTAKTAGQEEDTNNDEDATPKPTKRGKRTRKPRQPSSTPVSTPTITEDVPPFSNATFDERGQLIPASGSHTDNAAWTPSDKSMLTELLLRYGEDFNRIASFMPSKSAAQILQFYQAHSTEFQAAGRAMPSLTMGLPPSVLRTYRQSEPPVGSTASHDSYNAAAHSGEMSATSARFTTPPVSHSVRRSPFEAAYASAGAPRPFTPVLPRGSPDGPPPPPHTHFAGSSSMSHLSIPPIPMPDDRIKNPSPFTTSSPFSDYHYSHSPIPHLSAVTTLPDELRSSLAARVDSRGPDGSSSANASMAFDTSPAFVPPPQTWTHAPLGTTDDLVAYLEHRNRLASKQQ